MGFGDEWPCMREEFLDSRIELSRRIYALVPYLLSIITECCAFFAT